MKIKLAKQLKEALESNTSAKKDEIISGGYTFNNIFFLIYIRESEYSRSSATVDFIDHSTGEKGVLDNNAAMHYIRESSAA